LIRPAKSFDFFAKTIWYLGVFCGSFVFHLPLLKISAEPLLCSRNWIEETSLQFAQNVLACTPMSQGFKRRGAPRIICSLIMPLQCGHLIGGTCNDSPGRPILGKSS
jgi:hypothetical protein